MNDERKDGGMYKTDGCIYADLYMTDSIRGERYACACVLVCMEDRCMVLILPKKAYNVLLKNLNVFLISRPRTSPREPKGDHLFLQNLKTQLFINNKQISHICIHVSQSESHVAKVTFNTQPETL